MVLRLPKINKNLLQDQKRSILILLSFLIITNDVMPDGIYISSLVLLSCYSMFCVGNKSKVRFGKATNWASIFLLFMFFESLRITLMFSVFRTLVPVFLTLFIVSQVVTKIEDFNYIIRSFSISGYFLCVYLIVRYHNLLGYSRFGNNGLLVGTSIMSSIHLSYYLIGIICAQIWCLSISQSKLKRCLYIVAIIPTGALILFSGVRKAIVLPIFMVVMLVFLGYRKKIKKSFTIILGLGIGMIIIYYAIMTIPQLYDILGERMASILGVNDLDDYSMVARDQLASSAVNAFFENPILGKGVYATRKYFSEVPGVIHNSTHPHNNYLNLLVIGGIPLFLAYYLCPIVTAYKLLRANFRGEIKPDSPVMFLTIYLIMTLISDFQTSSYNIVMFTFFVGLAIMCPKLIVLEEKHA